jgi:hypothetical protein
MGHQNVYCLPLDGREVVELLSEMTRMKWVCAGSDELSLTNAQSPNLSLQIFI